MKKTPKYSFTLSIYNFLNRIYLSLYSNITTHMVYLKGWLQDVNIGKKCKFIGSITFRVFRGGQIVIGDKCTFVSKENANLIGVNHRCMLSATPAPKISTCTLTIGNYCGFSGTTIRCFKSIIIGNNVRCGANTLIMDGDAHFEDSRTSPPQSIIIKDNVFIGTNVVVKKGVTIGENSIIGMNSVVTHDIPANSVAVGTPCKVIHNIEIYNK